MSTSWFVVKILHTMLFPVVSVVVFSYHIHPVNPIHTRMATLRHKYLLSMSGTISKKTADLGTI